MIKFAVKYPIIVTNPIALNELRSISEDFKEKKIKHGIGKSKCNKGYIICRELIEGEEKDRELVKQAIQDIKSNHIPKIFIEEY